MSLQQLRILLPVDSIFRQPLVFELTLVLVLKILLLIMLWQFAFKPVSISPQPTIELQLLSKDSKHE